MSGVAQLNKPLNVLVKQLSHAEGLPLPFYATQESAGLDLCAAVLEPIFLKPFQRVLVPTGLCIALPQGYEGQIRPRSGLALKQGVTVLNAPGTIDADYRQEMKVLLINLGEHGFSVERGDRIAQLVVAPFSRVEWELSAQLEREEARGGFGSTGMKVVVSS
ncbi:MAG: dUTP diphosphatase [Alphaproteobacteria bacterium]